MKWKDVKVGDRLKDGSIITQMHPVNNFECFKFLYKSNPLELKEIVISTDHLLLCDISKLDKNFKEILFKDFHNKNIPIVVDYNIYTDELKDNEKKEIIKYLTENNLNDVEIPEKFKKAIIKQELVKSEPYIVDKNHIWLNAMTIFWFLKKNQKIKCNRNKIVDGFYYGFQKARCISTDTGRYQICDLIHHNSVTLRNVIFHCLTHSHDISVALIDLKLTEFVPFKDVNGVLAVGNSVNEACEILRIGREIMYARNAKMAKLGLVDMVDFKPQQPTNKIWVSGRELNENQIINVKIDKKETKEMTAKAC